MDQEALSALVDAKSTARHANRRAGPSALPDSHPAASVGRDAPTSAGTTPLRPLNENEVEGVVGDLRQYVQNLQRTLQFSVDEESGQTVVRVVDSETKEVIRQIPAEELLRIAHRLQVAGLLLTERI